MNHGPTLRVIEGGRRERLEPPDERRKHARSALITIGLIVLVYGTAIAAALLRGTP